MLKNQCFDFCHAELGALKPKRARLSVLVSSWAVSDQRRAHFCAAAKKKPGTRPGEVQQGGEDDERFGIIAFERSNRVRFLTNQEKIGQAMRKAAMCCAHGSLGELEFGSHPWGELAVQDVIAPLQSAATSRILRRCAKISSCTKSRNALMRLDCRNSSG